MKPRIWTPPGVRCNPKAQKANYEPKQLDPTVPEVKALIGMVNEQLPAGWAVNERELLLDPQELRIVCVSEEGVERWILLQARELMRAMDPDAKLRHMIETLVKREFPKKVP